MNPVRELNGKERSLWAYHHNALRGSVVFAQKTINAVMSSPSASPKARGLALEIVGKLAQLSKLLETRVDPWKG
jgi:hypothetical protein